MIKSEAILDKDDQVNLNNKEIQQGSESSIKMEDEVPNETTNKRRGRSASSINLADNPVSSSSEQQTKTLKRCVTDKSSSGPAEKSKKGRNQQSSSVSNITGISSDQEDNVALEPLELPQSCYDEFHKEDNGELETQNYDGCKIRWQIVDFYKQITITKDQIFYSKMFSPNSCPNIKFQMFCLPTSQHPLKKTYAIKVKDFGKAQSIEANVQFWIENKDGVGFGNLKYKNHVFNVQNYMLTISDRIFKNEDILMLANIFNKREELFICYKLDVLKVEYVSNSNVPKENSQIDNKEFFKNILTNYERQYDSTITIGTKVFKISKIFFTCQSTEFERLLTYNKNNIKLNDISEEAMKMLIKWTYVCKIENLKMIYELFIIACTYKITALKNNCLSFMPNYLTKENALFALAVSLMQKDEELKSKALECLKQMSLKEMYQAASKLEWKSFLSKNTEVAKQVDELIAQTLS